MAVLTIPVEPVPWTEFNIDLEENTTVRFTIKWNDTDEAWYCNLTGVSFTLDLKGLKLVPSINLLQPFAVTELGALYVLDTEGRAEDPDFDNWGGRYILLYETLA